MTPLAPAVMLAAINAGWLFRSILAEKAACYYPRQSNIG
jgi:hypothetical protein